MFALKFNFSQVLEIIAIVGSLLGETIKSKQEHTFTKKVSRWITLVSIVYLMLGSLSITDGLILGILEYSQKYWYVICIYICVMSILPAAVAEIERRRRKFIAKRDYAKRNLLYNLAGAVSALALFAIAVDIVESFSFLKDFYIEGIVSIFIPICGWLVLAYQSIEQKKKHLDYDASIKSLNQKLNMIHLFDVYFLSAISVMYIFSYTMYCYMHKRAIEMKISYYLLLTLMLIFFYLLANHHHKYWYLAFVTMVPVILIASVYWTSWFIMSDLMRGLQWLFLVVHSCIYFLLIYKRDASLRIKEENIFLGMLLVIVVIFYTIIFMLPLSVQIGNC